MLDAQLFRGIHLRDLPALSGVLLTLCTVMSASYLFGMSLVVDDKLVALISLTDVVANVVETFVKYSIVMLIVGLLQARPSSISAQLTHAPKIISELPGICSSTAPS